MCQGPLKPTSYYTYVVVIHTQTSKVSRKVAWHSRVNGPECSRRTVCRCGILYLEKRCPDGWGRPPVRGYSPAHGTPKKGVSWYSKECSVAALSTGTAIQGFWGWKRPPFSRRHPQDNAVEIVAEVGGFSSSSLARVLCRHTEHTRGGSTAL